MKNLIIILFVLLNFNILWAQKSKQMLSIDAGVETIIYLSYEGYGISLSYDRNLSKRLWMHVSLSQHDWDIFGFSAWGDDYPVLHIDKDNTLQLSKDNTLKDGWINFNPRENKRITYQLAVSCSWDFFRTPKHFLTLYPILAIAYHSYVRLFIEQLIQIQDNETPQFSNVKSDSYNTYKFFAYQRAIDYQYGIKLCYKYFFNNGFAIGYTHSIIEFHEITNINQLAAISISKSF